MKQLFGHANCDNEYEAKYLFDKLTAISQVVMVGIEGLHIEVSYTPLDIESSLEVRRTVARILDALEEAKNHGYTMIA